MYKVKSDYIYFISKSLNKAYFLNCVTKDIIELDDIGVELVNEILHTSDEERALEIIDLFEGCDLFEKRSS